MCIYSHKNPIEVVVNLSSVTLLLRDTISIMRNMTTIVRHNGVVRLSKLARHNLAY